MDVKALVEASKNILKAHESGDPVSTVLDLLKPLEGFRATEELLRQSRIGVTVAKLRQSNDAKLRSEATRLVTRWKQEVNAQSKKKRATDGSPAPGTMGGNKAVNGTAAGQGANSGTSSPAPQTKSELKAAQRPNKVDPEKRNTTTDGVDFKITGDASRDGCLKLMYDGIVYLSEESADAVFDVARRIEVAAFEHFKHETSAAYKQKMRSLFQNLKMKDNKHLRRDVLTMKIPPKQFVAMTSDELKSEQRRTEDEALEKENMNKAMTAQEEKAISTTYVLAVVIIIIVNHQFFLLKPCAFSPICSG